MAYTYYVCLCSHLFMTGFIVKILYDILPVFAYYYSNVSYFILYSFLTYFTFGISKKYFCGEKISPDNKAVLITGCDTGFGNALARRLDSIGFKVFAACLFPHEEGTENLEKNCSENLQVVQLDVRNEISVKYAADFVKENLGNANLWAIVNNAGIHKGICAELTSMDSYREVLDVNTLGVVRVTKAFLPLLKVSKGRVVNITSLAGRVSPHGLCAYVMSKYASVGFTECLSQEMRIWGIRVISIEPEMFRTSIIDPDRLRNGIEEEITKLKAETLCSTEVLDSYGEEFVERHKDSALRLFKHAASPRIDLVIDDLESAVLSKYPNHVYKPRWSFITRVFSYLYETLPFPFIEFIIVNLYYISGYPIPVELKKHR